MHKQLTKRFFILSSLLLSILLSSCSDTANTFQPLSADSVILAFGDSLTAGYGATAEQSYPAKLQELTGLNVINAGISGEISENGLKRLPSLLKKYRPALVILCHGGNDILRRKNLSTMQDNLQYMIDNINVSGAEVMLLAVPSPSLTLTPLPLYEQLADTNTVLFDKNIIADVLRNRQLKSDTIHPNAAGYAAIAERIYQQMFNAGLIKTVR